MIKNSLYSMLALENPSHFILIRLDFYKKKFKFVLLTVQSDLVGGFQMFDAPL